MRSAPQSFVILSIKQRAGSADATGTIVIDFDAKNQAFIMKLALPQIESETVAHRLPAFDIQRCATVLGVKCKHRGCKYTRSATLFRLAAGWTFVFAETLRPRGATLNV